jgi:hypothetical protein
MTESAAPNRRLILREKAHQMKESEASDERSGMKGAKVLERRRHRRYAINAVAEVLVTNGMMLFRGRVLDISLEGCFVETLAHLRLEPETPVEMSFTVNGVKFRIKATSRIVRPRTGAGFCFSNLNPRMQAELEVFIKAISQ